MEIPLKVKVGALVYGVAEKDVIEIDSDRNYDGICDYQNTEIAILKNLSSERKKDLFIHELTHAIFYEAGYEDCDQDEDMINRVAKVLHQVIKDNDLK